MKRTINWLLALSILALVLNSCGGVQTPAAPSEPAQVGVIPTPLADVTVQPMENRPNILFIMVDDLEVVLGTMDYMPYLRSEMIEQGLYFDDFIVTTPVCCPARATFLRGQYVHNHGVLMNEAPAGGFSTFNQQGSEASTVATWLQAAGYNTALMGKYLNQYPYGDFKEYVPPGWTEWYSPAKGKPYTSWNYTLNENGTLVQYFREEGAYITDNLGSKALDFIRRAGEDDAPFFLYLAIYAPHQPANPAPRHENLFLDLQAPRFPSINEEDMSDKPEWMGFDPLLDEDDFREIDSLHRMRVQSMQAVDELIPQLIAMLEETGQLENTYIIFTSDNGFHLGQHRQLIGKSNPYEEDILVPFIVRGPGVESGAVLEDYLGASIDWAPTIAGLAGVTPPAYIDGRSLAPLFTADRPPLEDWRQGILLEFFGHHLEEGQTVESLQPFYLGLRTPDYTYVLYPQVNFEELYDLHADPYQINGLTESVPPDLLAQLSELVWSLYACEAEECRTLEDVPVPVLP